MKHSFLTALILSALVATLFPNITYALGWHLQYQEANHRTLYGVKFVDSLNGWVVGDSGVILHTANGGSTYSYQTSATLRALRGVSFTDRNHGCAVGDSGKILHTNNGGTLWSVQNSGTTRALRSVSFTDSLHGCAVGDSGTILHTNNGGTTWNRQTSGTNYALNSVCFVDSNNGWAVGGYYQDTLHYQGVIIHTNNGGTFWSNQNAGTNLPLLSVFCTDSMHGWISGGYRPVNENFGPGIIILTNNSGIVWNILQENPYFQKTNVFALYSNYIWITEGDTISSHIRYSNDGGIHWWIWFDGTQRIILYGLFIDDTTHGWAVGSSGMIYFYSGFTSVSEKTEYLPSRFDLHAYPNPFNSTTTISYNLLKSNLVSLKVFELAGRELKTLVHQKQNAGVYHVSFDGRELPSGIYFCRLTSGKYVETRKMVLLK